MKPEDQCPSIEELASELSRYLCEGESSDFNSARTEAGRHMAQDREDIARLRLELNRLQRRRNDAHERDHLRKIARGFLYIAEGLNGLASTGGRDPKELADG